MEEDSRYEKKQKRRAGSEAVVLKRMNIDRDTKNGWVILRLKEPVTANSDISMLKTMARQCLGQGLVNIVLSFTPDSHMCTRILTALVDIHKAAEQAGGRVAVVAPGDLMAELFDSVGLSSLLRVYRGEDEV